MQAGVRLAINNWKGKVTHGATGTEIQPAMIGISGDMKYVKLPTVNAGANTQDLVGTSLAIDALLPIIPASDGGKSGNNLTITGEFATGFGDADQYTGFTGGVGFPATYTVQNIDNGIVSLDAAGTLHYIQWYTGMVGLQYYLPIPNGKVWIAANYAHGESPNAAQFGTAAKVVNNINWVNVDLFAEPVPGLRFGLSYGRTWDDYNGTGAGAEEAINDRVMGSAFFIF